MRESNFHVAIVGGGASGILSAIQLLRLGRPPVVHVFNDGFELARGVAYSAKCNHVVLNVPASRMSAFPGLPAHFVEWLKERHGSLYSGDSFVPRRIYGDYLRDTLRVAVNKAPAGCLHVWEGRVHGLAPQKDGYEILWGNRKALANAVVLALGNIPPANPSLNCERFTSDSRYLSNIWQEADKLHRIRGHEKVVILGCGLTALDAILQLRQQGHQGKIDLISRRGQWPSVHELGLPPIPVSSELSDRDPAGLVQALREKAPSLERQGGNWRQVIDGLRPVTDALWSGWTLRQRRSFLRHLRPYWDIHRHRMAPDVWQSLRQEIGKGAVRLDAGRLTAIRPEKDALVVAYHPRRQTAVRELRADAVINCTGSETLRRQGCQPLISSLLEQDLAQLDPFGLGLVTDSDAALLNATGQAIPGLYAIGPVRRGSLWETTAIPEIRVQSENIAREICRYRREKKNEPLGVYSF